MKRLLGIMSDAMRHTAIRHAGTHPGMETLVRIIADAIMLNAALAGALILEHLWSIANDRGIANFQHIFGDFFPTYLTSFWLLTLTGLAVFYANGFYGYSRAYQGRYKVLIIAESVGLSYLIFGFLMFSLQGTTSLSNLALVLACFFTLGLLVTARVWNLLWSNMTRKREKQRPTAAYVVQDRVRDVLVIGGAGYIGSALVERLLGLGYRVRVLDLLLYGDTSLARFYCHPHLDLMVGDFRRVDTVVSAVNGMNAVVHLGAIVGDTACSICEDLTVELNLMATRTIAEISKGFGIRRFVFASTCSVYGASDQLLDERSALAPLSLYARTKLESERVLLSMANSSFCPTILRFGTVYGLSGRPRFDLVVNLLAARAIQDGEAVVHGGTQWRPLVHVRDVAESIMLALQAPIGSVAGQIFNVGCNEQNYQIADLGSLIQEMVPAARIISQPGEDNRNYRVRFDKIHNMLGFKPKRTVQDGITEIIDAFATGTIKDYRDPLYSNCGYLSQNDRLQQALQRNAWSINWTQISESLCCPLEDSAPAVAIYAAAA